MNFDTSHISAFLLADHVIGALLDTTGPGLVISIDIGGSLFDTIAKTSAKSSFHKFMDVPTLARRRSLRFARILPQKPADIIEEAPVFGRTDGVAHFASPDNIFEAYGAGFDQLATHSIDSWMSGRPPLRYVHFGDPDFTADQIAGASETLLRDRPLVTVYVAGVDRSSLRSQIEEHGYEIFDLSMQPVKPDSVRGPSDFGWIAVPAERSEEAIAAVPREAHAGLAQFSEWNELVERNSTVRQHNSRAVFGFPSTAPQLLRTYSASDIIVEDDCYPAESDGTNSWRWFGPRTRTRVSVPCVVPGVYQIEIAVIATHLRSGLEACRILVEGREVRATIHGSDSGSIRFLGQLKAGDYAGYMSVDVVSPGVVSMIGTDSRILRLSVQSIAVSPWR